MSAKHEEPDWLGELGEHDADLAAALLLADLTPLDAPATGRVRLLEVTGKGRLARFAETLAGLIDVTVDHARTILDRALEAVGWETEAVPGISTLWVEGGAAVAGCIRGFVRMEPGSQFPHHRHIGDEVALVLEGAVLDSTGAIYLPGDIVRMPADTAHSYRAREGGTDLLVFSVVREGIAVGDTLIRHRDEQP